MIIGDWEKDAKSFDKAEEQLIDTEKHHQIYGTADIINPIKVFKLLPYLDAVQRIDLLLCLLTFCDIVYVLKSWEFNNDSRLLHDYADARGYKIIYSKKF
jgi:hypothetical protein